MTWWKSATSGQRWTAALALGLAALVVAFGGPGGSAELASAAPSSQPRRQPTPTTQPNDLAPLFAAGVQAATLPTPTLPPAAAPPFTPGKPAGGVPPKQDPCASNANYSQVQALLTQLDDAAGGRVPSVTLLSALGTVLGCSPADPTVLALGLLVESAQALPDPGLNVPLPPVPGLTLPAAVVAALQPLRSQVFDPVCEQLSTVATLAAIVGPMYPAPTNDALSLAIFQLFSLCGQVQAGGDAAASSSASPSLPPILKETRPNGH